MLSSRAIRNRGTSLGISRSIRKSFKQRRLSGNNLFDNLRHSRLFHKTPSTTLNEDEDDLVVSRQPDPLPKIQLVNDASPIFAVHSKSSLANHLQDQSRYLSTATASGPQVHQGTKKKNAHLKAGESSHQIHAASLSSSSSDTASSGTDNDGNQGKLRSENWRARAANMRENARERATHMRDSAEKSMKEFREDPKESMKSGAKSFSDMMQKYGPIFVGVHLSVYFASLAALFAGVDSGIMDPGNLMSMLGSGTDGASETKDTVEYVVDWMNNHSWSKSMAPFIERNPHFASLAVAWIAVKFTEPIRLPISLYLTPGVARYLGQEPNSPTEAHEPSASPDRTGHTVNGSLPTNDGSHRR